MLCRQNEKTISPCENEMNRYKTKEKVWRQGFSMINELCRLGAQNRTAEEQL
jgi:hypothetical protein